ncbi:MAG: YciI family protein [Caulobacterales bacterium]|jgi:hypothetical protein
MRFMFILTSSAGPAPPTPALMDAMHRLAVREIAAGRMIDDGGLTPPSMGARITNARGKVAVIDGPFPETKEVIGGYAVFEVESRDEGLALAREFMQLHVDHMPGWEGVMEMREVAGSQTRPIAR